MFSACENRGAISSYSTSAEKQVVRVWQLLSEVTVAATIWKLVIEQKVSAAQDLLDDAEAAAVVN